MNAKNKRILITTVIAVLLIIIGSIFIFQFANAQKTTIYVFNGNYDAGTVISADMLTPMQVDSKITMAGTDVSTGSSYVTVENYKEILRQGNCLRIDVTEGFPLMTSVLSINGGNQIEVEMGVDKVAVSVAVTKITGVTNELKENSRVNIYTMSNDASVLILQNMRVLSVAKDSNGDLESATVECTIDQSLRLTHATCTSTLYFGLVNSSGYEVTQEEEPSYRPQ